MEQRFRKRSECEGLVFHEPREIQSKPDASGAIRFPGLVKCGIGQTAPNDCLPIVFAAGNLGIEAGKEAFCQLRICAYVEGDFIGLRNPVEATPDLASK